MSEPQPRTRNNRAIEINDKLLFSFIEHNWPNEAPTVFEIAGRLDRHVGNMYAQIKRLENRGWVDRVLAEGERRERVRIIARPSEPPQPVQAEKSFSKHQVALVERQERKSARSEQRERRREGILRLRNEYRMTLKEIGQALGLSTERVRQIAGPTKIKRASKAKRYQKKTDGEKFYERFWANIDVRGKDECWLWRGLKYPSGYGRVRHKNKESYVHRVMYQVKSGEEIAAGMVVMHTCDNPGCVNPNHLRLGTPADNMHDRDAKGRHRAPSATREMGRKRDTELATLIAKTYRGEPATIAQLAELAGCSNTGMYFKVRRLEQRGLVRYERHPGGGVPGLVYARPA